MTVGTLQQLTTKGVRSELHARMDEIPEFWRPHCTDLPATTKVEPFAWAGAVPKPREMVDGRRIKGLQTFTYSIENKTYELSVLFPQEWVEDDQTGSIKLRVGDMARAYMAYKPELFTAMLEQGGSVNAYDGNTFFHDSRTEGSSAAIDNNLTSVAAADNAIPTPAEFLSEMAIIKAKMSRFQDNEGRPANVGAMNQVRILAPPEAERSIREALKAVLISNTTNVYGQGLAEPDFNLFSTYSATTCTIFVHAVGGGLKGMIYQQRTPLSVMIYDDPFWIDYNGGTLVTLRERFVFAYGDFRRIVKHVFTT